MTGLIVRTDLAPDITSINDLFDPQYKGKVDLLAELRDTVPLVMKAEGIDPETATKDQWLETIQKIEDAIDSGQIRDMTGNDYVDDLPRGDVVAAIGWSGDAEQLQLDNPAIQFRVPDEGCIIWSDDMVIPIGAPNPGAAYEFMNFIYQPEIAAQIAGYVNYTTPVEGRPRGLREAGVGPRQERPDLPLRGVRRQLLDAADPRGRGRDRDRRGVGERRHRLIDVAA